MPRVSRLERGTDFHGEVAFGDGHGDAGHFSISDHIVEVVARAPISSLR